ncbi:MAG: HAD-superfamily subfamily hydrolase [Acidimicrobiales bacterium]|nr:HAD-superfamily subfamily hydrolase [Acidimicrobiales bacterium]
MTARPDVAAFDFDGTITLGDTLLGFLGRLCGNRAVVTALMRHGPALALAATGRADADAAKAAVLARLLAGRDIADVERVVQRYTDDVLTRRLRPAVIEKIDWHRARGDTLLVVSASPELYVDPIARRLGFHATLATRLEVDRDGRLTGRLVGANVQGAEKVARLRAHLGDDRPARLWAYGNSRGDADMLEVADVATMVTRRGLVVLRHDAGR